MAKKFISYNGRIVSDNLSLKLLGQDVSPQPTPPSDFTNCKSLVFDGIDDFVTMGNVLNTSSTGASSFSMSCWFKTNATTSTYYLMSKARNVSQLDGYQMFITGSGEIRFFIGRYTGISTSSPWLYIRTNSNAWNDNNWHNVILTYNGNQNTSGLKIYIDNSSQSLTTLFNNTPSINSTSSEFMIGARGTTSSVGGFFDGKIDEASFFNTELSASDVSTIYNGGAPNDISSLSPLSWWRMGDGSIYPTINDEIGGNNGTMVNMSSANFVNDVPEFNTKSILLDGVDDYVRIGTTSLGITNAISISAWVKIPTTNTGGGGSNIQEIICEDATSGSNRNWFLNWRGGGLNRFQFGIWNTDGSFKQILTSGITPNDNQWHHLLATYDGTSNANGLKLYVDGATLFTETASSTSIRSTSTVEATIGAQSGGAGLRFEGNIDEVAVWNTDESANVSSIYNSGVPNDIISLSPLSWWRMGDGDTFPTLIDRGSGGNNGTMTNMVSTSIVDDVPLYSNKSFEFDGVDDYVEVADSNNLSFGNGTTDSPFSISAWIKMNDSTRFFAVSKGLVFSTNYEYLFQTNASDKLGLFLYDSSNSSRIGRLYNTPLTSYENQWIHICSTYNGSGLSSGIKVYLNGVRVDDTNSNSGTYVAMENGNRSLNIGRTETGLYSNGNIDELAVFNTELSPTDITDIYNGGVPNDISCLSPLSWWRMGEDATFDGTNWSLVDNGSGGNDGTSQNMGVSSISNDVPPSDWTPTNVNTVAWIDASDTGSYTTAGSTLTSVTDKAGTYTMNIGNTPTVVSGGLNSLNVFDFDGNGEYLQSSTYSNQTSSGNHWAIGVFLADFVDGDKDSFWSYETNQSPKRDYAISSAGGGSNSWPGELDLDALSSNRISSTIGNLQGWNLQSVSIDSWVIVSCWFNKTGNQIGTRVNGNNAYTPVNDYDNSISPNQELRLMRNRASQELDGRLAEFFTVADITGTGGTDLTDLEKAEGYLAWKWGLEGNLPVSHPYKNSPPTV